MADAAEEGVRLSTGIAGLDAILGGGLPRNRLYLVQGDPGTGKTTLALQFLLEGRRARRAGPVRHPVRDARTNCGRSPQSHGWSLERRRPSTRSQAGEDDLRPEEQYTAFHPSEVELGETVQALLDEVERRQAGPAGDRLAVRDAAAGPRPAPLPPADPGPQAVLPRPRLHRPVAGRRRVRGTANTSSRRWPTACCSLERTRRSTAGSGGGCRSIKLRGVDFHGGYHDFAIQQRRARRLPPPGRRRATAGPSRPSTVSSGVAELDALLGGGPERGTSTLVIGPAGPGKSTLCRPVRAGRRRAGRAAGRLQLRRAAGHDPASRAAQPSGWTCGAHVEAGRIDGPADRPGRAVAGRVHPPGPAGRRAGRGAGGGHRQPQRLPERHAGGAVPAIQMHELLDLPRPAGRADARGRGPARADRRHASSRPVDVSYLADTVLLLRYFEHAGRVRKAISVVKKRGGRARGQPSASSGSRRRASGSGEPLAEFRGVLTGTPDVRGRRGGPLLGARGPAVTR